MEKNSVKIYAFYSNDYKIQIRYMLFRWNVAKGPRTITNEHWTRTAGIWPVIPVFFGVPSTV
jgi:hypothetical protein